MSGMLNVNGCDDPSYRYKMPRLVGKIEGRGNGIKTVIVNCSDIAQSLHRPSGQVCKFFGCELGAMSKYEDKIDRALVNGAFETSDLQSILTKYIEKFVLCPSCGNPETEMELKGKRKAATIWLHCKACGAVEEADNSHKLCTYILKEMTGPSKGSTKEERKKKREMRKNAELNGSSENLEDSDEKKKKKDKTKKKEKDDDSEKERRRKKKEKKKDRENGDHKSSKMAPEETESSEHSADDDFLSSPSMESLTLQDDATVINNAVKSLQGVLLRKPTLNSLIDEVTKLQVGGSLPSKDKISILFFGIVSDQQTSKITEYLPALTKFGSSREDKLQVLACLEESVARADATKRAAALTLVPLVLKQLYDDDVLDEEIILEWYEGKFKLSHPRFHVSNDLLKEVKAQAQPIVQWLQEAEDESDEDE